MIAPNDTSRELTNPKYEILFESPSDVTTGDPGVGGGAPSG